MTCFLVGDLSKALFIPCSCIFTTQETSQLVSDGQRELCQLHHVYKCFLPLHHQFLGTKTKFYLWAFGFWSPLHSSHFVVVRIDCDRFIPLLPGGCD